jgi:hypothetical protein
MRRAEISIVSPNFFSVPHFYRFFPTLEEAQAWLARESTGDVAR